MNVAPIERVRLLLGHDSPQTAYLVEDYPYGRKLRCRIRYWVETATRGAKRGQRRFVSQTTNPRLAGQPWNKPHPGTYALLVWMYLDAQDHVQHTTVSRWGPTTPAEDAWLQLCGIYDQLPERDRDLYDTTVAAASGRGGSGLWQTWQEAVDHIATQLAATGTPPEAHNGFILAGQRRLYLGGDHAYPVAVAAARAKLAT